MESASTDFPKIVNARVEHSFLVFVSVKRPFSAFKKCL